MIDFHQNINKKTSKMFEKNEIVIFRNFVKIMVVDEMNFYK